jgi:hypothetical protein
MTLILSLGLGVLLSILVLWMLTASGGSFQFKDFIRTYPIMFSLIVFLMIGSRKATLWIKDGFSKSDS